LSNLDAIPEKLREKIFLKLFEVAEIAKYNDKEQRAYQDSLKYYRDLKNALDTVFEDGFSQGEVKGKLEGKLEIAQAMKQNGFDLESISKMTGLSVLEIENL
jgi:predicted transposase/invertase (TIGR01784 family)